MHPIKHLFTVLKHKWLVFVYACRLHIPFTGLVHDLTKFSPTEFWLSSKYYAGDKSPTIVERKYNNSVSRITLHHTLRNKHHWHSYVDYLPDTFVIARINYKHSVEYVCDIISASKVYMGKGFKIRMAYDYFLSHSKTYLMHPANKEFILWCVNEIDTYGFKRMKKKYMKENYNRIIEKYDISIKIPFNDFNLDYLSIK